MVNPTHTFPSSKLRLEATANEKTVVVKMPSGVEKTIAAVEFDSLLGRDVVSPGSVPIRQTLYSSFSPRSRTSENNANDAVMQALLAVQMPALPGPNSSVIITPLWSYSNSASVKTLACRFGGSDIGAPTVTTSLTARHFYQVHNANSMSAQKTLNSSSGYLTSNNALIQTSVDTSQPFIIDFRVKWGAATSGETITLEGVIIELVP